MSLGIIKKSLILCALGLLVYFPTLKAPFCFDDHIVIVNNPLLQDLHLGWKGVQEVFSFQHSRFLSNLSLSINFYFHQLDTFGYHLVNLVIHLLTGLGVWFLGGLILQTAGENKPRIDVAFWAALLFLVHPVNTEAVSFISQRSSSLAALFYLWSVIFYIQARNPVRQVQRNLYFAYAGLFAALAILSKETAMTLPLAWMLVDVFFIHRKSPRLVWGVCLLMVLIVAAFFDFHWKEMSFATIHSQSHRDDFLTPVTYLLTQLHVLVVLFKLIFLPIGLNLDYDFAMAHSLFEAASLFSFVFLGTLLYMAIILRKTFWPFSFIVGWFFISLLTHIFPPRGNVIAEHKLYLTLTLFIPVGCYGLYKAMPSKVFKMIMMGIIVVFSLLTLQRNMLWSNPILLWQDTVAKSPAKARPYVNLAKAYLQQNKIKEGLIYSHKAMELAPEMPQPYINMSEIYFRQNDVVKAMSYINQAVAVAPKDYLPYMQRGILWARQHQDKEAIADFTQSLMLNPNLREVYKMRGLLYARLHQEKEALADLNTWLIWNPHDEHVLSQIADIHR